jgi:putative transposase
MIAREGFEVNHKKVKRIYREEKLQVRRRGGRKRALGTRKPMVLPDGPNQRWSLDFVSDALPPSHRLQANDCRAMDGRRFRILAVVDDFSRENLVLVADTSLSGRRVARELDKVIAERGMPKTIVSDNHCPAGVCIANAREGEPSSPAWRSLNGFRRLTLIGTISHRENPNRTASLKALTASCAPLMHINMHCRAMDEGLNETLFGTLADARHTLEEWQKDYNWRRPHSALGNLTPMEFLQRRIMDKMAA